MVLLHGINNIIIIYHPSYLGIYQDEAKNEYSNKILKKIGSEPNQKALKKAWCMFLHQRWVF